jgi:hypothetical protein
LEYTHKNYICTVFLYKKTGENPVPMLLKFSLPYFSWAAYALPLYGIIEGVLAIVDILGYVFHMF